VARFAAVVAVNKLVAGLGVLDPNFKDANPGRLNDFEA